LTEVKVGTAAYPNPSDLTAVGGTLFFIAADGTGYSQLWQYDGRSLTEVTVGTAPSSWPGGLTAVGSTLYFTAADGTGSQQLWEYDGRNPPTAIKVGTAAAPAPVYLT